MHIIYHIIAHLYIAHTICADDIPDPRPDYCTVLSNPQENYSKLDSYLTFYNDKLGDPLQSDYPVAFNLSLSNVLTSVDYPRLFCSDGSCTQKQRDSTGYAYLDTTDGTGQIEAEFDVENFNIGHGVSNQNLTGRLKLVATNFDGWDKTYSKFMRRQANGPNRESGGAVAGNIIQHGASDQGEPAFPLLRCTISVWGHADVYLDGDLLYSNFWLHFMYTNRYRHPESGAIMVEKCTPDHSECTPKVYNHTTDGMLNPVVYPNNPMEVTLVVARQCQDPNPNKPHGSTDIDILTNWDVNYEVSP